MKIPKFWAEARIQKRHSENGERAQITLRRWGWSDISQADAQTHAQARVEQALANVIEQGWPGNPNIKIDRREPKTEYNGAYGVPIREEIVISSDPDVITRNSYGALCLNTPDVMIVDLDEEDLLAMFGLNLIGFAVIVFLAVIGGIGLSSFLSVQQFPYSGLASFCAAGLFVLAAYLVSLSWRMKKVEQLGGATGWLKTKLLEHGGKWALYRTPAGARAIRLDQVDKPSEPASDELMAQLGSDPAYRLMCRKQHCYRARLTPKPWRIDFERLRGPVWPVEGEKLALREQWIEAYDRAREGWGAVEWVEDLGQGEVGERNEKVRKLHDQWALPQDEAGQIG